MGVTVSLMIVIALSLRSALLIHFVIVLSIIPKGYCFLQIQQIQIQIFISRRAQIHKRFNRHVSSSIIIDNGVVGVELGRTLRMGDQSREEGSLDLDLGPI
jgi:hypothetical protein